MKTLAWTALGVTALWIASPAAAQEQVALHTWFSATRGDHFTTSDPRWIGASGDVRPMGGGSGYVMVRHEGTVFRPDRPQPAGTVPLYSFWNPERGDNFLTSDSRWVGLAAADGYTRYRLEGYLYPTARTGTVPLRSFWSASRADNYASTDPRLAISPGADAGERTRSVEGGRYTHYRVEGHMPPPLGPAPAARTILPGLVDMHTHLMAHLGFGNKLLHGAPDAFPDGTFSAPDGVPDGSLLPAGTRDCNPGPTRAATIGQALGHDNSTHGGWDLFSNPCGDHQRNAVIRILEAVNEAQSEHGADKSGWPSFSHWPRSNDITHQQMWVDWIRRAHADGLRVMVTLALHNQTITRLIKGDPPFDDRAVADRQISETIAFVNRHEFMEVARTPADLRRIVRAGRLAVVLGVELDDLGNFMSTPPAALTRSAIRAEVARLRTLGVRYVFPVHLTDNPFAGTAVKEPLFNVMNRWQTGQWWQLECTTTTTHQVRIDALDWARENLGIADLPSFPPCSAGQGHRNARGLTPAGHDLMDALMRAGLLIDVDHMSEKATDEALRLARDFPSGWGYPLVSGHNGPREPGGSERSIRPDQLESLRDLGGMLGLGWAGKTADTFRSALREAHRLMGSGRVGFGSDINGFEKQPAPRAGAVSAPWRIGDSGTWDYAVHGVSNYGMLGDFFRDVRTLELAVAPPERAGASAMVNAAESFARTWERAELAAASALAP